MFFVILLHVCEKTTKLLLILMMQIFLSDEMSFQKLFFFKLGLHQKNSSVILTALSGGAAFSFPFEHKNIYLQKTAQKRGKLPFLDYFQKSFFSPKINDS
jgi:hypothetical protein